MRQTPQQRTRTSTCPGPGAGRGRSIRASGPLSCGDEPEPVPAYALVDLQALDRAA